MRGAGGFRRRLGGAGPEPESSPGGGWGKERRVARPSVPASGRSPGPSLRSARHAEIRPRLPVRLQPPCPESGETRPPPHRSAALRPSAGAGAASLSLSPQAHPPRRPWREETPRGTGEWARVRCKWPGALQTRSLKAFRGSEKTGSNYNSHQPTPSAAGSGVMGVVVRSGGGGLGGGRACGGGCVLGVTFPPIPTATTWSGSASSSWGWAPSFPGTSSSPPSR